MQVFHRVKQDCDLNEFGEYNEFDESGDEQEQHLQLQPQPQPNNRQQQEQQKQKQKQEREQEQDSQLQSKDNSLLHSTLKSSSSNSREAYDSSFSTNLHDSQQRNFVTGSLYDQLELSPTPVQPVETPYDHIVSKEYY